MCYHRTIEDRSGKNLEESPTLSFCSKCIYPIPDGYLTNLFINHLSLILAQHHQQKVIYIAPPCPLPQMQGNVWHFFLLIGHVSKWLSSLLFADTTEVFSWSADKGLEYLNLTMRLVKEGHRITIQVFLFVIQKTASSKNWSKGSIIPSRHFIIMYSYLYFILNMLPSL